MRCTVVMVAIEEAAARAAARVEVARAKGRRGGEART